VGWACVGTEAWPPGDSWVAGAGEVGLAQALNKSAPNNSKNRIDFIWRFTLFSFDLEITR
jgi:hypothetical protein